ncbi:MAG TPA: DNA cytosine methyltransferase [Caulobacteraceae bacterium]|jgi:DNA (cytosine-5)-methyltransferase 1|nr:DNA cytosine methyltransferase [Caulobacteraceae bacterium]
MSAPTFHEFFAGGGMAGAGLGGGWKRLFANDIDPEKAAAFADNWGAARLHLGDIATLTPDDLPGQADLAWASFPCQDLSLAGLGAGLAGARSGTFFAFWRLIAGLAGEGRAPPIVVMENVCGALTSHSGRDFVAICAAFAGAGYRLGALVIDAALFRPQSRPRLFLIGVRGAIDPALVAAGPEAPFHPPALQRAIAALAPEVGAPLIWWRLPAPATRNIRLVDLLDNRPLPWRTKEETRRLIDLMSPVHRAKLAAAAKSGQRRVGTVCRRMRPGPDGATQRAEVRFDGLAACLRTPGGGSSRQILLEVEGPDVRSRLLSAREMARLMGLADDYQLPDNHNAASRLTGDGVVVDVVRHLAAHLLEPLVGAQTRPSPLSRA